ncbi:MAG: DNA alkylation repair protein [Actinomycetota bacterium]
MATGAEPRFSLKDELFNAEKVAYLAGLLCDGVPGFDRARFESEVLSQLTDLELKARINWIADVLTAHLPDDFPAAADAIEASLPPPLDPTRTDDDFGDFIFAPFGTFVATNGLDQPDRALSCLRELTMRFSMEDPIRAFLRADPERTLDVLDRWASDDNYHVRRLVSEGTRPRLPWSGRLALPIDRVLALLDQLHADPTRYVTRSVANHLNDIAKDDPATVLDALGRWRIAGAQQPDELAWLTRHALRTLIKAGHDETLAFLGYRPDPPVDVELRLHTGVVVIGEALRFDVELTATGPAPLIVDYVVGFRKANGSLAPKTFKLKTFELDDGETVTLSKTHRLRGDATTYRLHPGDHDVTVQVNGAAGPSAPFRLVEPAARLRSAVRARRTPPRWRSRSGMPSRAWPGCCSRARSPSWSRCTARRRCRRW